MEGKNENLGPKDKKVEATTKSKEKLSAFEAEILKERSLVLNFVRKEVSGTVQAADVEDITQQTMVKALQSQFEFRGDAKLASWLLQIAKNLIRDHFRTKSRREKLGGVLVSLDATDPDGKKLEEKIPDRHPGVEQSDKLLLTYMQLAWQELTSEERELLNYSLQGYGSKEMSQKLEMNENTFKTRTNRARNHMREILTRLGLVP